MIKINDELQSLLFETTEWLSNVKIVNKIQYLQKLSGYPVSDLDDLEFDEDVFDESITLLLAHSIDLEIEYSPNDLGDSWNPIKNIDDAFDLAKELNLIINIFGDYINIAIGQSSGLVNTFDWHKYTFYDSPGNSICEAISDIALRILFDKINNGH